MWECLKCGEHVEDSFDVCWACGTSRDGIEDPTFQPEADVPEPSYGESYSRGMRGLAAGAAVAAASAFLSPALMLLVRCTTSPFPVSGLALLWFLRFGLLWAPFAALAGAIAGTVGALRLNEGRAVATGAVACLLSHVLFLMAVTNAFSRWPREIILGSLAMAALAGSLAGLAGVVAGRRHARKRGQNDATSASR